MHWVTKVFIVGAAVLSVLLAALVMAYSVNVKELRDEHANLVAQKLATESSAQNQATAFGTERDTLSQALASKDSDMALMRQQLTQLQGENSTARADKLRSEAEREAISQKIAQLGETSKTLTTLVTTLTDEVRTLRDNELKFRKREIELVDRNNDLEAQKEVLQQQSRALDEQLAEQRRLVEAMNNPQVPGGGDLATPVSLRAFNGRITEVKRDPATGDMLAQIDLGANDGVKDRMELWLARDTKLLGKLTVIKTDLRTAVGRVDTLGIKAKDDAGKVMEVRPEDKVYSSPFR